VITEQDLNEAIAQCQGQKNPNANTCIKLAAFYTIKDKMYESKEEETAGRYSYDLPQDGTIIYDGDSDFAKTINNKNIYEILPVLDELMETLKYINPRLYRGILEKL
jgi:hypothetical protein